MKKIKIIAMAISLLFPIVLCSQNPSIEKLYEKYKGKEGFTTVNISKDLLSLLTQGSKNDHDEDNQDYLKNAVKQVNSIQIIDCSSEGANHSLAKEFYNDVINSVHLDEYKELLAVDESKETVKILQKSDKSGESEFIVFTHSENQTTLISLFGIIDFKNLLHIGDIMHFVLPKKDMDIKGFKNGHEEPPPPPPDDSRERIR